MKKSSIVFIFIIIYFIITILGLYAFVYTHEIVHKTIYQIFSISSEIKVKSLVDAIPIRFYTIVTDSNQFTLRCRDNCLFLQSLNEIVGYYLIFFYIIICVFFLLLIFSKVFQQFFIIIKKELFDK